MSDFGLDCSRGWPVSLSFMTNENEELSQLQGKTIFVTTATVDRPRRDFPGDRVRVLIRCFLPFPTRFVTCENCCLHLKIN